jgi:hypothetical protein
MRSTSIATYEQIVAEGLLPEKRLEVYECIFERGPCTATQVEVWLNDKSAHKRTSELRDQGVLYEKGEVDCPITGRPAILWDVTDALPTAYSADGVRESRKQLLARLEELERLVACLRTENVHLRLVLKQLTEEED